VLRRAVEDPHVGVEEGRADAMQRRDGGNRDPQLRAGRPRRGHEE
jgi:hypothetical protein